MGKAEIEQKVATRLGHGGVCGEFGSRRPSTAVGWAAAARRGRPRALVFEPKSWCLMDEPLGALDKNLREEMQYEIKHIHENVSASPWSM